MELFSKKALNSLNKDKEGLTSQRALNDHPTSQESANAEASVKASKTNNQQGKVDVCRNASFDSFKLTKLLKDRIKNQLVLDKPTKVQAACIPRLLDGESCIAHAPTGTGKTLAFGIPLVHLWGKDPYGVFGLILTPTRELALQIKDQLQFLGGERAKVCLVIGGVDFRQQALELYSKPSFVVSTPGRLLDHLKSDPSSFKSTFRNCKYLVYDEADKLLDGQFDENLDSISGALPKKKQVMFFSATIPSLDFMVESILQLSGKNDEPFVYDYLEDTVETERVSLPPQPEEITNKPSTAPLLSKIPLTQKYILCPRDFKDGYLMELLRSIRDDDIKLPVKVRSMIIFAATIRETQVLSVLLSNLGFENTTLHSHLDQKARSKALTDFRSSKVNTLVATDVVSRGLDIRTVDLVINYSIPMPPDYVHRVGRTGRAGQPGLALMFVVPPRDVPFIKNVETYIGEKLTELKIDERKVLEILTEVQANRKLADLAVTESDPFEERAKINNQKKIIEAELEEREIPKRKKRRFIEGMQYSGKGNKMEK